MSHHAVVVEEPDFKRFHGRRGEDSKVELSRIRIREHFRLVSASCGLHGNLRIDVTVAPPIPGLLHAVGNEFEKPPVLLMHDAVIPMLNLTLDLVLSGDWVDGCLPRWRGAISLKEAGVICLGLPMGADDEAEQRPPPHIRRGAAQKSGGDAGASGN
eukprot:CAMPEP_0181459522 /NCGR_PEP_ID=MMETSP1110-20121109/32869_1 /TAXON_ID=174948 /ORGANISM="Symbiodinium sp., Strain CCMP421" /LENGTH=156 /DNA_ID=CAMNT_0023584045 /DNA_START=326 /DNA_END=793 /DNA_ORIENTATION=-